MQNKHGNTGNKNALKDERDKATSFIHWRITPADKALLVKAAGGEKLAAWGLKILREQAQLAITRNKQ